MLGVFGMVSLCFMDDHRWPGHAWRGPRRARFPELLLPGGAEFWAWETGEVWIDQISNPLYTINAVFVIV